MIVFIGQSGQELFRNFDFKLGHHTLGLDSGFENSRPWKNGNPGQPRLLSLVEETGVSLWIKKHVGDAEIRTGLDFVSEKPDALFRVRMVGIDCSSDAKIRSLLRLDGGTTWTNQILAPIQTFDLLDQLVGVRVAIRAGLP